jgi:hypothetical protein
MAPYFDTREDMKFTGIPVHIIDFNPVLFIYRTYSPCIQATPVRLYTSYIDMG